MKITPFGSLGPMKVPSFLHAGLASALMGLMALPTPAAEAVSAPKSDDATVQRGANTQGSPAAMGHTGGVSAQRRAPGAAGRRPAAIIVPRQVTPAARAISDRVRALSIAQSHRHLMTQGRQAAVPNARTRQQRQAGVTPNAIAAAPNTVAAARAPLVRNQAIHVIPARPSVSPMDPGAHKASLAGTHSGTVRIGGPAIAGMPRGAIDGRQLRRKP